MKHLLWAGAAISVAMPLLAGPALADPLKAEMIDNWGTGAERAAVQVLQDNFAKLGGELTSTVVQNGSQVLSTTAARILAGDPPTANTFSPSSLYLDLFSKGQYNDINDVAIAGHWKDVLPPFLLDAITYKGKVYIAPISMTVTNWVYSNKKLLAKAGVDSIPNTYDDSFFAVLDKLKAAGVQPLGIGGDTTVYRWTYESVAQAVGGEDLWMKIWDKKDEAAVRSDLNRKVFETYKRLHNYADEGASGRNWAAAVDLVVSDQAAMTIVGDWGKAEFINAGKVPGVDFECQLQGNPPMYVIHGDMFGFPRSDNPDVIAAQKAFAKMVMVPAVQADYNIVKSGNPARMDVNVAGNPRFDECAQKAAAIYSKGKGVVGSPQWYLTPDGAGAFSDLLADYFNYPEMTTDQAIDQFWQILSNDKVPPRE